MIQCWPEAGSGKWHQEHSVRNALSPSVSLADEKKKEKKLKTKQNLNTMVDFILLTQSQLYLILL